MLLICATTGSPLLRPNVIRCKNACSCMTTCLAFRLSSARRHWRRTAPFVSVFPRSTRSLGALHRFGAAVIQALHALLPGHEMDQVQIPLMHVGGQEHVQPLAWQMNGARSAACSIIQRWSSSNAVLYTTFSCSVRKSRCCTEPSCVVMLLQVSSSLRPYFSSSLCEIPVAHGEAARQRLLQYSCWRRSARCRGWRRRR